MLRGNIHLLQLITWQYIPFISHYSPLTQHKVFRDISKYHYGFYFVFNGEHMKYEMTHTLLGILSRSSESLSHRKILLKRTGAFIQKCCACQREDTRNREQQPAVVNLVVTHYLMVVLIILLKPNVIGWWDCVYQLLKPIVIGW